ncbi:MAG: carbohydrate ABC transporter permease, partial [Nocardioides sp.]
MRSRRIRPFGTGGPLAYVMALAVIALTLGPVLYGMLGGFRSNEQLARDPAGLPDPWLMRNYEGVVTNPDFWRYALNSTMIAVITTVVAVVCGVMAAYPLARYQFKMREPLFMVFVLGLLFPAAVA